MKRWSLFFNMSNSFQRTFQHLQASNDLLHGPPMPTLRPAPVDLLPLPPSMTPSTETHPLKIVRGRTTTSQNLLHNGHRYSKDRKLQDGRQAWRCVRKDNRCKGRLYTQRDELVGTVQSHNHEADFADTESKDIYSAAKDLAASTATLPSNIMKSVKRTATDSALLRLPKPESFRRALNKAKKKENPTEPAPSSLENLKLNSDNILSFRNEQMLLHDNEDSERRIIIFGTKNNLEKLQECPSWYVDATFKPSPQLFYQLLTIHGEIPNHDDGNPWTFPCVYILLTHKDEEMYTEAFSVLASLGNFRPDTIMTDFELGLRNSLSTAFPHAHIDGCFFHLCQAILRWVTKNGLKKTYEQGVRDPETGRYQPGPVRVWVRRLQHLAFLPVDDVPTAFHLLLDEIPSNLGLDDFLSYFMITWIQGVTPGRSARFPPSTWNVHDRTISRLNRTNNYLEAWNKQFAALVGHAHPTIWNFMSSMFMEQSSTDEKMLLQRNGDEPPRRKKRHVVRDTRLYHRVLAYDSESLDDVALLISYLDSLRDVMEELD